MSLAAASLADRPGAAAAAFVDAFTGTDRYVLDYLCSEVLARLPADLCEFLLRTSILRRLSPSLCAAVTGRADAAAVLDRVERAGVFLVTEDPGRQSFRYHRLFGELLWHELRLAEPTRVPELHRRAAAWSAAHGAVTDAVHHHIAAGDAAEAAELVARHWNDWFDGGRLGTVTGWLDLLPAALVRADPRLCAARAWLALDLGRLDEVDRWVGAGDLAAGPADLTELGDLAVLRSVHRFKIGDLTATRVAARRVLELGGGEVCFAATVAHLMLGVTAFWNDTPAADRRRDRRRRAALAGAGPQARPRLPVRPARLRVSARTGGPRSAVPERRPDAITLSERERELLPLLAGTLSQREIGEVLHLSVNTVKTHSRLLFRKLGISSRTEAVARARELGLL